MQDIKNKAKLESMTHKELVCEIILIQKKNDQLLGEWEQNHEQLRAFIQVILEHLSVLGEEAFDHMAEKQKLQPFFDKLFCEGRD